MPKFSISIAVFLFMILSVWAQQPTTTAPLIGVNSKYTQGIGPGYWPTAGSGLTLNLTAGTSFCDGSVATYAGGTLSLTDNATNRVYLNGTCTVSFKTTAFTTSDIPIATVVTSSGAITSITDQRTMFVEPSTGTTYTGGDPIDVTGSVISCPTCSTDPLKGTAGGFFGGYKAANQDFGIPWAQTLAAGSQEYAFPMTGYIGNIGFCVPGDNTGGETQGMTWDILSPVATVNTTWRNGAPIMGPSDTALPCTQSFLTAQPISRNQLIGARFSRVTGSTDPTGWAAQYYGGTGQPMGVGLNTGAPGAGTTSYTSVGEYAQFSATEGPVSIPVPYDGTLSKLCVYMVGAQPGTGSLVFTVRDTGVDTSVVTTVPASGVLGIYCDDTNTHDFVAGDLLTFSIVNNASSGSGGIGSLAWVYTPATAGRTWIVWPYGASATVTASTTQYITAWARVGSASTTEANWRSPIPASGTMQSLYCYITNTPTNNVTVAPNESGTTSSSLTLTMTGGVSTGLISGSGSEAFDQGDSMDLSIVTGAGTQPLISGCSAEYVF